MLKSYGFLNGLARQIRNNFCKTFLDGGKHVTNVPAGSLKDVPPFDAAQPIVDAISGTEVSIGCDECRNMNFRSGVMEVFRYVVDITELSESEEASTII